MNRTRRMIPLLLLLALVAAACQQQQPGQTSTTPEATQEAEESPTAAAKDYLFEFALTGAAEKPGPGDEDGAGTAKVNPEGNGICFDLEARNIDKPDAAHIHEGAVGVAGPIVFELKVPEGDASPFKVTACSPAEATLSTKIRTQPQNYYVNIHNPAFKSGAIRGQLSASAASSPAASPAAGGNPAPGY